MRAPVLSWSLLVAGLGVPPLLWYLDTAATLPLALRDRPWAAGCCALAVAMMPALALLRRGTTGERRATAGLLAALVGSAVVFGWLSTARYALPQSSRGANVGALLPAITLTDESGSPVDLSTLRGQPTLLVWFAGSWCPFCREQLKKLAESAPEYAGAVRIFAVTSDPPEELRTLRQELKLPFPLLSDPTRMLMRRCELMHCVAAVDPTGTVRWGIVSGNWRNDLSERAQLQAAYALR
jgi:peroxiredoxin